MEKFIKLTAIERAEEASTKNLKEEGLVPAILYGPHLKNNILLKVNRNEFVKVFAQAGESTLIDLEIEGKKEGKKIVVKDVQTEPVSGNIIHIDFYEVDMKKPIEAVVSLNFVGESGAVKNLGGALIRNIHELEIKCLPTDLINHIDIDISKMDNFGDTIAIKDIKVPGGVEILKEDNEVVAIVVEPKKEEEKIEAPTEAEGEEEKEAEGKEESNQEEQKKEA